MKKRWIVLFLALGGIIFFTLLIAIAIPFVNFLPGFKERETFMKDFDLELKGRIIEIKADKSLSIACLKVEESNYKEFRMENDRFFIRVKDSLAVLIYNTMPGNSPRYYMYENGTELLINYKNNWQVLVIENGDTVDISPIWNYPTRDYLNNSCIPN